METETSPITASKHALRVRFRLAREALSEAAYAAKSAAIAQRVAELPVLEAAQTIHCYWPLTQRREVDTRSLIQRWHAEGRRVVLPVVRDLAGTPPEMEHRLFTGPEALRRNRWGLHEPVAAPLIEPQTLDAVIVPAFGADRRGHRIGHGGGYYDAFLRALDVPTIALVYDACLVDAISVEPHDVPVTCIVTEHRTLDLAPPRA